MIKTDSISKWKIDFRSETKDIRPKIAEGFF